MPFPLSSAVARYDREAYEEWPPDGMTGTYLYGTLDGHECWRFESQFEHPNVVEWFTTDTPMAYNVDVSLNDCWGYRPPLDHSHVCYGLTTDDAYIRAPNAADILDPANVEEPVIEPQNHPGSELCAVASPEDSFFVVAYLPQLSTGEHFDVFDAAAQGLRDVGVPAVVGGAGYDEYHMAVGGKRAGSFGSYPPYFAIQIYTTFDDELASAIDASERQSGVGVCTDTVTPRFVRTTVRSAVESTIGDFDGADEPPVDPVDLIL